MYTVKLIKEILLWLKVRRVAKDNEEVLNEKGFRIDWIGRIYTVINLPEEIISHNEHIQQAYILDKFRNFDNIFLEIGIGGFVFPEFRAIDNSSSYLLILSPDRKYANLKSFSIFIIKLFFIYVLLKIIYKFTVKYFDSIESFFSRGIDFIF